MQQNGDFDGKRTLSVNFVAVFSKRGIILVTNRGEIRIFSDEMKKEAFENLFRKYYNEAKLYVLSMCRDELLAEDLVADAFYKAFVTIDEEKDGFKYWLLKVCRNCLIDRIRKDKKYTVAGEEVLAVMSGGEDPASSLIKKEEYRALYRALSLIKPSYKESVILYYFEGLSVSEIAKITEQSAENVKVTLFRARAKLKEILEESI